MKSYRGQISVGQWPKHLLLWCHQIIAWHMVEILTQIIVRIITMKEVEEYTILRMVAIPHQLYQQQHLLRHALHRHPSAQDAN